jgi:hypothetical protein
MTAGEVRAARPAPFRFGPRKGIYPSGFQECIICLGDGLSRLLDWPDICRLIQADTLEEWISTLPEPKRPLASRILEIPYSGHPSETGGLLLRGEG